MICIQVEDIVCGDVKYTDHISHPVKVKEERCNLCVQEEFRRCVKEHPDWFTPKTKVVRADKRDKMIGYLEKMVKEQICMVFECSGCGYYGDETETIIIGICAVHLASYLDEIYQKTSI